MVLRSSRSDESHGVKVCPVDDSDASHDDGFHELVQDKLRAAQQSLGEGIDEVLKLLAQRCEADRLTWRRPDHEKSTRLHETAVSLHCGTAAAQQRHPNGTIRGHEGTHHRVTSDKDKSTSPSPQSRPENPRIAGFVAFEDSLGEDEGLLDERVLSPRPAEAWEQVRIADSAGKSEAPAGDAEAAETIVQPYASVSDIRPTSAKSQKSALSTEGSEPHSVRVADPAAELDIQRTTGNGHIDHFAVLPCWKADSRRSTNMLRRQKTRGVSEILTGSSSDSGGEEDIDDPEPQWWLVMPESVQRAAWDFGSVALVMYDLWAIPFQLLEPPPNIISITFAWVTRLFWTADIPMSCVTALACDNGTLERRFKQIACNYLRTWFLLDFALVALDWMEVFFSAAGGLGIARVGKASRIIRIIRLLRLLRLVRVREIFKVVLERLRSERLVIFAKIMKIMGILVGIAHIMACLWYGIGLDGDMTPKPYEDSNWIREHLKARDSLVYRYFISMHWSLSQFSGGMDEIRAHNVQERIYVIACYLVTYMGAAFIISDLTSAMTQLYTNRQSAQLRLLHRYLSEKGISPKLTLRIQQNAQRVLREKQHNMSEDHVELLAVVSKPLRTQLHFEMYSPTFCHHPFFEKYCRECPHVMRLVCHDATSMITVATRDILFAAGEMPAKPTMYFICSGNFLYTTPHGKVSRLAQGAWLAEASLWCQWMHVGTLMSLGESRLQVLDAKTFQSICVQFDHSDCFDTHAYAIHFVRALNMNADADDLEGDDDPRMSQISRRVSESALAGTVRKISIGGMTGRRASLAGMGRRASFAASLAGSSSKRFSFVSPHS